MAYRLNPRSSLRAAAACVLVAAACVLASAPSLLCGEAHAAALPSLTVGLTKASVTIGGSPQSGAVNVVTSATGVKEANVTIVRLNPGVSAAELLAFANSKEGRDPNNVDKFGAIVLVTEPGSEVQTTLQPGQYVAVAEAEEKLTANAAFTVAASGSPAALPPPQTTIRSIDFGFRGPATLHTGELVRFENEGFVVHMDIAFRVRSRRAARQLVRALRTDNKRLEGRLIAGPPVSLQGPVSHGVYQQQTITAKPGWYVQACFMDTQDGREHTLIGMERAIRILK
jgi:hypothetical protein